MFTVGSDCRSTSTNNNILSTNTRVVTKELNQSVCNESTAPLGWIDCMLDKCSAGLFGCDENNCSIQSRQAMGHTSRLDQDRPSAVGTVAGNINDLYGSCSSAVDNFAVYHEEFLDSMLHEQVSLQNRTSSKTSSTPDEERNNLCISESAIQMTSSMSMTSASDNFSQQSVSDSSAMYSSSCNHFPIHYEDPNQNRYDNGPGGSIPPLSFLERSQTVEFNALAQSVHKNPAYYVHPQCRMQKDKGRGDDVGSAICARGIDQCLLKLRAKMKLLTEHTLTGAGSGGGSESSSSKKGGTATMKRRPAKVVAQYENFLETRSVIELRLGILSMSYGVLLRWDARKSGKITLILLRKNCHDSFYPKKGTPMIAIPPLSGIKQHTHTPLLPLHENDAVNRSATIGRSRVDMGSDVSSFRATSLQPPYRVPRPDNFDLTTLSVAVLYCTGLGRKSNYSVQLSYGTSAVETIFLSYDMQSKCMSPMTVGSKGSSVLRVRIGNHENLLPSFEIKLFEQRSRRRNKRRLLAAMKVPTMNLERQSSMSPKPVRIRVPCQHDPKAAIQIEVMLISDYSVWIKQELEVRKNEDVNGLIRRQQSSEITSFSPHGSGVVSSGEYRGDIINNDEDSNVSHWDWICCFC